MLCFDDMKYIHICSNPDMDVELVQDKLWGEIPELSITPTATVLDIIEPKPVEFEVPRLHQPSSESHPPKDELPTELLPSVKCPLDRHKQNLMLHAIELQYHKRRIGLVLMAAQHQQGDTMKSDGSETHPPLPAHPPIPKRFCSSQGIITPPTNSTLLARIHSHYSASDEVPKLKYPRLDSASNRQLLLRSVASICAFSGFEMCNETALETLTDTLHDFNTRLCKVLRATVDDEARVGSTPFPDVLDGTLHEIGLGGTAAIQKYWKNNIQDYALRLQREDKQLIHQYQKLVDPSLRNTNSEDAALLTVKMEEDVERKYSSSTAFKTFAGNEHNSDGSSVLSPYGTAAIPSNGPGDSNDPTSPNWTMQYKTEPVDDSYDDPISVVPATPQPSQ